MSTIAPGTGRLAALPSTPSPPPANYCLIYFKDDNVLYIQDSTGVETAIGVASGITALTGDVLASGPGSASASVVMVGGKTAAAIATAVNDVQAATNLGTPSTIVKRDALGNFIANVITASLIGAASDNVLKAGDTMTGPLNINSGSSSALIVDTNVLVVDGATNKVGINKVNPNEALDVVGNGVFSGSVSASNISGVNTGDITITDTDSINLTLVGQDISADIILADATLISTITGIKVGTVADANIASGVDAAKIADGSVDNTEFQYLNGVTSAIQTQLNNKQPLDSTLTAFATYNTNGILVQTASDTFTGRTIQAGTGITVTDGDGVAGNPIIATTITQYTDENAQDAVGGILTDTASIDFTYNDAGNTISADVLPAGVDHNLLLNYSSNEHIDHTSVSINAGTGLTGGGDISSTRTISMPAVGIPSTYGSASSVPVLTTDTQGRVNAVTDTPISITSGSITDFTEATQDAVGSSLTDTATIDFTYNDVSNQISAIVVDGSITDVKVAPGIDATKIADGSVDNTEFQYLDGVTSAIQTQLDAKASTSHASTHLPSGSDPLTTAAPTTSLSATTTNASGTAESFSKSDHTHAILTGTVSQLIPDQTNSTGSSSNLARADHIHNIPSGTPVQVSTTNFIGAAASFALSDHVHSHGNQTNGSLHAAVTTSVNGFMSAADKVILDAATSSNTASTIVKRDGSGNFSAGTITASLTGTASNNVLRAGDTMTGALILSVVALTDAATITTDASLGNIFTVTLGGNRTLGAPTNPTNGQKITYRIRQDAVGSRTLSFDAVFNFGTDLAGLSLSTTALAFDYIGCQYNSVTSKWDVLAISRNY